MLLQLRITAKRAGRPLFKNGCIDALAGDKIEVTFKEEALEELQRLIRCPSSEVIFCAVMHTVILETLNAKSWPTGHSDRKIWFYVGRHFDNIWFQANIIPGAQCIQKLN